MRKGSYSEELVKHEAGWIVNRHQAQDLSRAIHVLHEEAVRRVCELELQHQVVTDSRNAHFLRWYTGQKRQVLD